MNACFGQEKCSGTHVDNQLTVDWALVCLSLIYVRMGLVLRDADVFQAMELQLQQHIR